MTSDQSKNNQIRQNVKKAIKQIVKAEGSNKRFADKVGVSKQAVSNWIGSGSAPDIETIAKISNVYDVPVSSMFNGNIEYSVVNIGNFECEEQGNSFVEVPLYGSIAAGTPIEMIENDETFVVPSIMHERYPNAFLLKVNGESMNRKIPNGSYALIDPTKEVVNGKVYAVCVNGFDATIKRVRKLNNGFELIPDSIDPTFKTKVYDYGEPGTEKITVIGRVVWYTIPFDYEI